MSRLRFHANVSTVQFMSWLLREQTLYQHLIAITDYSDRLTALQQFLAEVIQSLDQYPLLDTWTRPLIEHRIKGIDVSVANFIIFASYGCDLLEPEPTQGLSQETQCFLDLLVSDSPLADLLCKFWRVGFSEFGVKQQQRVFRNNVEMLFIAVFNHSSEDLLVKDFLFTALQRIQWDAIEQKLEELVYGSEEHESK